MRSDHERLWNKLYKRLQSWAAADWLLRLQAAVDLPMGYQGKTSGLPVIARGGCGKVRRLWGPTELVVYERVRDAGGVRGLS